VVEDFPGDYYGLEDDDDDDGENPAIFKGQTSGGGPTSLIFVVDAQDEPYDHVLQSFTSAVTCALLVNPNINVEVFINKVDGELFLSDESKYDCRRDVMTQVTDELADAGFSPDAVNIRYHLTSIYDHSIYEALSRVVQKLLPQLQTLENLLNSLVSSCSMEKAYLFDVVSKLYISTDSGPADMQSGTLLCVFLRANPCILCVLAFVCLSLDALVNRSFVQWSFART
jgi:Ras-related GTP-binding protein C/D